MSQISDQIKNAQTTVYISICRKFSLEEREGTCRCVQTAGTGACRIISVFFLQTTEPSSAPRLCNIGPKKQNISQTKQKQKNKQYFP